MWHRIKRIIAIALGIVPYTILLAQSNVAFFQNKQYVVGVDIGVSPNTTLGNSVSFPLGYSTFSYSAGESRVPLNFGASFGKNFSLTTLNTLQIKLSYHYTMNMNVHGTLAQGISLPYYTSTYSYSMDSSQLLAEAKFLRQYNNFFPYFIGGIGAGFNNAHNFSTEIPEYLTLTPSYQNKSTNTFSFSLGLGLDYLIRSQLFAGIGYRFTDLGSIGLGDGIIRTTEIASYLKQSHLYLNTLLIELNWSF